MGIGRFGRGCLGTSQSIKGSLMSNVALSSRFDYLVTMAFVKDDDGKKGGKKLF